MANLRKRLLQGSASGPLDSRGSFDPSFPRPPRRSAAIGSSTQSITATGNRRILNRDARGLVISPPVSVTGESIATERDIDPVLLRAYVLFWDQLDMPDNNIVSIGSGSVDIGHLESEGILSRTKMILTGSWSGAEAILRAQVAAYEHLEAEHPGQWVLGKAPGARSFSEDDLERGRAVLFELHEAIPIPAEIVPLSDVLLFKERRAAELKALRAHLDILYQSILGAPDRPLAKTAELDRLDRAIAEYIAVCREGGFAFHLSSPQMKINLDSLYSMAFATVAAHAVLPLPAAAAAGLVVGATKIAGSLGVNFGLKKKKAGPFEYVAAYHRTFP